MTGTIIFLLGTGVFALACMVLGVNVLLHPEESRLSADEIYQERIRHGMDD